MKKEIEQILKKRIKKLDLHSMGEFEYEAQEFTNKEMSQVLSYIEELEQENNALKSHNNNMEETFKLLSKDLNKLKRIEEVLNKIFTEEHENYDISKDIFKIKSILEEGSR